MKLVLTACLLVPLSAHACGKELWNIKTLADADSAKVDFSSQATTIAALSALPAPPNVMHHKRSQNETVVWRIQGSLVSFKHEADGDYHLVIQDDVDPTKTMIVEIPDPVCMPLAYQPSIALERSWLIQHFGDSGSTGHLRHVNPTHVEITGVGFFDYIHGGKKGPNGELEGQTGHAPNGIELHPVLSINTCN